MKIARTWRLGIAITAVNAMALNFVAAAQAAVPAAKRPSVLLITSEDNGPELGCYGDPYVRTPNLDQLAASGVRFMRAFVTTASCSESRSTLLTGLYPHQNGQIGLATHYYRTFEGIVTLPVLLSKHGYRTGLIGKLHLNPETAFPFDERPDVRELNTFGKRDVARVAELAGAFMRRSDEPYFLMVNFADAHLPFLRQQHGLPAEPLSADDVRPLPWIGMDTPGLRQSQADYYNCMMRLDTGIGLLLDALEDSGTAERTLVIYLGDHGAQFPRGKLASFESSLRVPLIVRMPGRTARGRVCQQLVSTIDLVPTILSTIGAAVPDHLPGESLWPLVAADAEPNPPWREYLCSEYHGHYPPIYYPQRTIRDGRYKLILNLLAERTNPVYGICTSAAQVSYVSAPEVAAIDDPQVRRAYATWRDPPAIELYDLSADPYEFKNRADDPELAEVQRRLAAELARWRQDTADPLLDPDKLARLTAEHDALPKPYAKRPGHVWKYPEYLRPSK